MQSTFQTCWKIVPYLPQQKFNNPVQMLPGPRIQPGTLHSQAYILLWFSMMSVWCLYCVTERPRDLTADWEESYKHSFVWQSDLSLHSSAAWFTLSWAEKLLLASRTQITKKLWEKGHSFTKSTNLPALSLVGFILCVFTAEYKEFL